MGTREEYTTCMKPHMKKGEGDRKERFCVGSQICSGKASTEQEAAQLCAAKAAAAAANPKPPKAKKGRKVCTMQDLNAISVCLAENITLSGLHEGNMQAVFANALSKCSGAKSEKSKRITSAKQTLETMDPQHIKALETIAKLSQQAEGRPWGRG